MTTGSLRNQKDRAELMRLLKEQLRIRQGELFGGLSPVEQAEYDANRTRITELGIELRNAQSKEKSEREKQFR